MKEIHAQFRPEGLKPDADGLDKLAQEYKYNQWVKCRTTRVGKGMEPSLEQHGILFKCFELVTDNNDNPSMQTTDSVKEACKIGIDFRDPNFVIVRPDGGVQFKYRSFSFKELPAGRERDEVMQKCFIWCSEVLGLEIDDMVVEAKSRMQS